MGAVNQIVQAVSNEVQHISDVVSNDPTANALATAAALGGAAYLTGGSSLFNTPIDVLGGGGGAEALGSTFAGGGGAAEPALAAMSAAPAPMVGGYGSGMGATSLGDLAAAAPTGAALPAAGAALTPAAIESLTGQAGYGASSAAAAAAPGLGIDPALVGAGAGIGAAGTGLSSLLSGAGSAIGNTLGNLSGTQLAALGTGATGLYNASATRQAMQDAIGATQAANAASQGTLGNIYNQQLGYQAPYQAAGVGAVNQLAGMTPYLTHQFNAADLQAGLAPNYDFMLQQGQQANQRAANVGGGALGGNALAGLNQYTQNYASTAYQNAFNNYQNQRQNIYSDLAGIAGIGQNANVGAGTAGTNYGQGITNLNTSLANAQSANILGQAQVGAGGLSNAANTAFLATILGQNTPTAETTPAGTSSSGTSISDIAKLLTSVKGFTG